LANLDTVLQSNYKSRLIQSLVNL